MTKEKALATAPAQSTAISLSGPMPEGFENMEAADIVVPRIRLWHPQSDVSPDGAKLGDYVDLTAKTKIGNAIEFFILAQKTVEYENEKKQPDGTMKKVIKTEKHCLTALLDNYQFPRRIEFSSAGLREMKRLVTQLFMNSQAGGGLPMYTWLIKATSENLSTDDGGKYASPLLEIVREATDEEKKILSAKFKEFAPDFLAKRVVADSKDEDLPFGKPDAEKPE